MAISVADILARCELEYGGVSRWGERIPEERPGVYLVSSSPDPRDTIGNIPEYSPDMDSLSRLKELLPTVSVDGSPATERDLATRLGRFWIPDTPILYIGLAGTSLRSRVRQYYSTQIGARSPHAGGWWLKTLVQLDQLHVHYAATDKTKAMEQQLLDSFAESVSTEQRNRLFDRDRIAPFANVNVRPGLGKRHGLKNYKMPRISSNITQEQPTEKSSQVSVETATIQSTGRAADQVLTVTSQRVTANDLQTGVLRLPKGSDHAFPKKDTDFTIQFRGELMVAKYRSRSGRSSIIRLGRALLGEIATENEPMRLEVRGAHATIIE